MDPLYSSPVAWDGWSFNDFHVEDSYLTGGKLRHVLFQHLSYDALVVYRSVCVSVANSICVNRAIRGCLVCCALFPFNSSVSFNLIRHVKMHMLFIF